MHIKKLQVENFRNLEDVALELHPALNFFYGDNGAGKTSVLEALVVMARGKSFKTGQAEELTGKSDRIFRIFCELVYAGRDHRMGLERNGRQWKARKDGQDVALLSTLTRLLPLILIEPNSHLLVSGTPDGRRRYLDWGVFHVEHNFLEVWRRFSRALKQRNAALRAGQTEILDGIEAVLADSGEQLHQMRVRYLQQLTTRFSALADSAATRELKDLSLDYEPGWKSGTLLEALRRTRQRDLEQGATSQGPHRADLQMNRKGRTIRTLLSRGEQKSLAAMLLLTQAHLLAERGEAPLVLLDDLASEFDAEHFRSTLEQALICAGQIWITGTTLPTLDREGKAFHVEHGAVREVV